MWALRRASSSSLRIQGLNLAAFRASAGIGPLGSNTEDKSSNSEHLNLSISFDRCYTSRTCHCCAQVPCRFLIGSRGLSSQAGAKSGGEEEDDLGDGFSELETPEDIETAAGGDLEDDSTSVSESESDLSGDEKDLEDTLVTDLIEDTEENAGKAEFKKKRAFSTLTKLILDEAGSSISAALDKYAADGKDISRSEIYDALLNLRRRKLFGKALQLSDWVEKNKKLEFVERDYASRVDLIAKVRGIQKAEDYIDNIPKSEVVYRTLLANCVATTNVKKSEEIFNKMRDLEFLLTTFVCNQLLLLYKRTDKKKIADVLVMMEKQDLKPTPFTYQVLIDTKGQANDMAGMDQIFETMKSQGIEPNTGVLATLARHYAAAGLKEKAQKVLKEMEGSDLNNSRWICPTLLPIYANLNMADEVERIWENICEPKPREIEFMAAIGAWGKLKNTEKAEAIFNKLKQAKQQKLSSKHYATMLRVYSENKMLKKGKELLKEMGDRGCYVGPAIWDALVKLYVDAGEVEKADSVLQKAAKQNQQRPLFSTYMAVLDQYAKRGDVHNAEKIFHRMRQVGYVSRARPFQALLQAYITGKAPAYGIRERMKADNVFPNKGLAAQLVLVDAFRKTAVSDLID